jgi:hypothetical protein
MKRYAVPVGRCQTCGKLSFLTSRLAKEWMKKKFPKTKMSVYPCGDYYHFGHTPYGVKRGFQPRGAR